MVPLGVGEPQQPRRDHSGFGAGVEVPDGTVVVTRRCVWRPVGTSRGHVDNVSSWG